jgi:DNA-binding MarR family transcriptional regulator
MAGAPEDRTEIGELITELHETAATVRARGETVARSAGQTQARWQVLFILTEGPLAVPALAKRLGLTRQSVQRIVDLLAAEGLLRAVANPAHQRSPRFELTAGGTRTLRRINAAAAGWHAAVRSALASEDRRHLRRLLGALREVAGTPPGGHVATTPAHPRRRRAAARAGHA